MAGYSRKTFKDDVVPDHYYPMFCSDTAIFVLSSSMLLAWPVTPKTSGQAPTFFFHVLYEFEDQTQDVFGGYEGPGTRPPSSNFGRISGCTALYVAALKTTSATSLQTTFFFGSSRRKSLN